MKYVSIAASLLLSVALPLNGESQIDINALQEALNLKPLKLKVLSWAPRIFLFKNFLTDVECDYIIARARPTLKRSTVVSDVGGGEIHQYRTSMSTYFDSANDLILKNIEHKIAELTKIPEENGEPMEILYYGIGGEYRPHWDYFDITTKGGAEYYSLAGQREATVIMYLADVVEGGETVFPEVGIKVKPVKGNAVVFFNCTPDGKEDRLTLHGGAPVIEGEKWIATRWICKRARK